MFFERYQHLVEQYSLPQKRWYQFPILSFPSTCSNTLAAPVYGVYISQLIRYSRACGSHQDFLDRGLLLTRDFLNWGFLLVKLKTSLRKFYIRHHDLVNRICNWSNTAGAASGTGTVYPCGTPKYVHDF